MTDGKGDGARSIMLPKGEHPPAAPHILIVEQQPAIQEMLCWMLHLAGYRTTVCAGRDAAFTWREEALPEDDLTLILLDLSFLYAAEAADFLYSLRARWRDAGVGLPQIIMMTTSPHVKTALGQRERVLLKPFHIRELFTLIQLALPIAARAEENSLRKGCTGRTNEENASPV